MKKSADPGELKDYGKKRQALKTPEPWDLKRFKRGKHLVFVVHKHAARRLHYDLRLEMNGVLKSFAVPKGPSLDPSKKRLAVLVEDHPFSYRDFEGNIPQGNYGAGKVIIWDKGFLGSPFSADNYEAEKMLKAGLEKGDLKFLLAGTKLKGEFGLVKTNWDEKSWLLMKKKDVYVSTKDILKNDRSVVSGRKVEEMGNPSQGSSRAEDSGMVPLPKAPLRKVHNIEPMIPVMIKKPFNRKGWLFEVKWDGYRAISELDKKGVRLYSRNGLSLAKKFPPIVEALQSWARIFFDQSDSSVSV